MEIKARTQYDDRNNLSSDLDFSNDKGLTKQSDAKDCDINSIFRRFEKTGVLPDIIAKDGRYGDFSSVPDYQEACNIVSKAQEQFYMLDVQIRNRFANDPAQFLAFMSDEKNLDEIEKMGLLKPEVVQKRAEERAKAEKAKYAAEKAKAAQEAQ